MTDPNDVLTYLKDVGYEYINVIKNAQLIEQMLTEQPQLISYIQNQTPRQQYIVLAQDIKNVVKLKSVDENALVKALEYQKTKLAAPDLIDLVKNYQY